MKKGSKVGGGGGAGDVEMQDLIDQLIKIIGTQSRVIESLGDALTSMKVAGSSGPDDEDEDEDDEEDEEENEEK